MKWVLLPNNGDWPFSRSSHTLTFSGSRLYLFGGENVPRTPIDDKLFCYDLNTKLWTEVKTNSSAPNRRVGHAAAALNGKLYIFGGRHGIEMGEGALNDLWCFDPGNSSWTQEQSAGVVPPARSFHTMTAIGGSLYVFGGCGTSGRLNDLWVYNVNSKIWQQLPSSPHVKGRGGAALVAAATNDALFVICGFCGTELSDTHKYDICAQQWDCPACCEQDTSSVLPPRSVFGIGTHACSACAHGQHIVLFGGEVDPSSQGHAGAGNFSNALYCLEPGQSPGQTQAWHQLSVHGDAPKARGWCASAAVPEGLVIHGGMDVDNVRLDDMYLLLMHED